MRLFCGLYRKVQCIFEKLVFINFQSSLWISRCLFRFVLQFSAHTLNLQTRMVISVKYNQLKNVSPSFDGLCSSYGNHCCRLQAVVILTNDSNGNYLSSLLHACKQPIFDIKRSFPQIWKMIAIYRMWIGSLDTQL